MNTVNNIPEMETVTVSAPKKRGPKKGDPRCAENGRKGGQAVRAKYGPEFFSVIGQKGGAATKTKYGEEFYHSIGRMGGEKRKETADYSAMGRMHGFGYVRVSQES